MPPTSSPETPEAKTPPARAQIEPRPATGCGRPRSVPNPGGVLFAPAPAENTVRPVPSPAERPVCAEEDLLPLSALQHYCFCPRQCALIHVEQLWQENYLTSAGRLLHERVDRRGSETRCDLKQLTALRIVSHRLGVSGIADMVELHRVGGRWAAYPVEYKHGQPKSHRADEIQLCAQAMALEEMRGEEIAEGALFYGAVRRRQTVRFDAPLRQLTAEVATAVHALVRTGVTPPPVYTKACEACSLYDLCRPREIGAKMSAKAWLRAQLQELGL